MSASWEDPYRYNLSPRSKRGAACKATALPLSRAFLVHTRNLLLIGRVPLGLVPMLYVPKTQLYYLLGAASAASFAMAGWDMTLQAGQRCDWVGEHRCSFDLKYRIKCEQADKAVATPEYPGVWSYDGGESAATCAEDQYCQIYYSGPDRTGCEKGPRPKGLDDWTCERDDSIAGKARYRCDDSNVSPHYWQCKQDPGSTDSYSYQMLLSCQKGKGNCTEDENARFRNGGMACTGW
ncbi:hypothetical protein P389DRAFT_88700 [Cystobasidium minutum MCA 4210]|uniref:uncharacterized protein n=1 Tax=Cystobasidium minutum MCA 4210 TaxID=1397322 RepID=UPI0034CD8B8D|eukprot:jgi/Rhomi1/88700/CE88699_74